jgi:hypothetical protein
MMTGLGRRFPSSIDRQNSSPDAVAAEVKVTALVGLHLWKAAMLSASSAFSLSLPIFPMFAFGLAVHLLIRPLASAAPFGVRGCLRDRGTILRTRTPRFLL